MSVMNDHWVQKGQYSLDLPSSWQLTEREEYTEIYPESGDAAIHVSVYRKRTPHAASAEDAIVLIDNFSQKNKLRKTKEYALSKHEHDCSCLGHFSGSSDPSGPSVWAVRSLVGRTKGVLVTLCSDDSNSQSYKEGLDILASLKVDD